MKNIEEIFHKEIMRVTQNYLSKKEQILKDKFLEKVGFDIEQLKNRRFNFLITEDTEEFIDGFYYYAQNWWYNDGSENGLLIVSFYEERVKEIGANYTLNLLFK